MPQRTWQTSKTLFETFGKIFWIIEANRISYLRYIGISLGLFQQFSSQYLNEEERSRVIQSLIELKNNLAAQGRYTDAVDDVLCKVLEAKKKKLKIEYI